MTALRPATDGGTMEAAIGIVGITDEVSTCDCCGRQNLKRTVAIRDAFGEVSYYGTTCAADVLKRTAKDVDREAKAVQARKDAEAAEARRVAHEASMAAWTDFLRRESGMVGADVFTMIQALGGFAAARARYGKAV